MYLLYQAAPILTISLKSHEIIMLKSFMCKTVFHFPFLQE